MTYVDDLVDAEEYGFAADPPQPPPTKIVINGTSVVEQVLAGIILLGIGAVGAHLYESRRK